MFDVGGHAGGRACAVQVARSAASLNSFGSFVIQVNPNPNPNPSPNPNPNPNPDPNPNPNPNPHPHQAAVGKSFLIGQLQKSSVAGQMRLSLPRAPFSPVGSSVGSSVGSCGAPALSPGSQWLNATMGRS